MFRSRQLDDSHLDAVPNHESGLQHLIAALDVGDPLGFGRAAQRTVPRRSCRSTRPQSRALRPRLIAATASSVGCSVVLVSVASVTADGASKAGLVVMAGEAVVATVVDVVAVVVMAVSPGGERREDRELENWVCVEGSSCAGRTRSVERAVRRGSRREMRPHWVGRWAATAARESGARR